MIHLYLPFLFLLLQLITDVNLAVSVEATQAIGNLAKGLRTHFSGNSRVLLPVLLVSIIYSLCNTNFHRNVLLLAISLHHIITVESLLRNCDDTL